MAYAANTAGPTSECTEAVYYACIAYGTSPSPLGPWTYRGVILDPVSSTTSHPGIVVIKERWYIVYHTADAKNGGHFRRSVAIDRLEWDDGVSPARIKKVVADGRCSRRCHTDREHRVVCAHCRVETFRSQYSIGCAR
jgi:hypothetical protein